MLIYSIFILTLLRLLLATPITQEGHTQDTTRQTKAEVMLKYMNQSANPCADFYEFACGNFQYHQTTTVEKSADITMDDKVKKLLETKDATDTSADKQLKAFYKSCIDVPNLPESYKLRQLIEEYGKMPLLEGEHWSEDDFDWLKTIGNIFHDTNVGIIIAIDTPPDFQNSSINRACLNQALPRGKHFYLDESKYGHDEYIEDIANDLNTFLGVDQTLAKQSAQEMFQFETQLAQDARDEQTNIKLSELFAVSTIDELQQKYLPVWDFKKLLNLTLETVPNFINVQTTYITNTMEVLRSTPKRVMANYIFYGYMKKFTDPWKTSASYPLNQSCVETTNYHFFKALNNMIYRKLYTEQHKQVIALIWRQVKELFIDNLQSPAGNWIRKDTRQLALEKLREAQLVFGTYEDTDFDQEVKRVHINDHDYVDNMKSLLALRGSQTRTRLRQPPNKDDFLENAAFSPAYHARFNYIAIPVSILAPNLLWSSALPYAYNFANIGFIIAHEISHALDDDSGWDVDTANKFEDRKKCFIEQYSHYTVNNLTVPAIEAQSENIADNNGLRLAYEAYIKWYETAAKTEREMESMPGLNYTNNQLFFINYAQLWCSVQDTDELAEKLVSDTHAPDKLRVIAPLSNLELFPKEFSCPKGSRMNPETKCKIY